ncbi:MAG: class I SAM-dependent methyltransferase, partial [Candidatus Binatia bacterium]
MHSDKTRFQDYSHALEFDQRAARSDVRVQLCARLIEALGLMGQECVLDIATGTGRFAFPVSGHLNGGRVVGVDEAFAMLRVAREKIQKESMSGYLQAVGDAEVLPFRDGSFDCAFVAFSLHHFGRSSLVVQETRRVLKSASKFAVLDPVVLKAKDSLDESLNNLINQVFRRSHGEEFRFYSAEEIRGLLGKEGFEIKRADLHSFSFDQDGMEGIPTGRHWLEVAEELQGGRDEMRERFEKNYFQYRKKGEVA